MMAGRLDSDVFIRIEGHLERSGRRAQPTPENPFDAVTRRNRLEVTPVRPATTEKVGVPELPDTNTRSTLISAVKDSEPLRKKKFEFAGVRPFCVNPTERTLAASPVFFTMMKRDT